MSRKTIWISAVSLILLVLLILVLRTVVFRFIEESYADKTISALIDDLKDRNPIVRREAANALYFSYYSPQVYEAIPALIIAIKDENKEVCWAALRALGNIGPEAKEAVPAVIEALVNNNDEMFRFFATSFFGEVGPEAKEAVPVLVELLEDEDMLVRYSASVALGQIDPKNYADGGKLAAEEE